MAEARAPSRAFLPEWLPPHRVVLVGLAAGMVYLMAQNMRWDWIPKYLPAIAGGLWTTVWLLIASTVAGFLLAVPIGLVQVTGPLPLRWLARGFCTVIRGTPLLLQIWLLYYGLGSLMPLVPGLRQSWLWPYLIEAWPYAFVALTFSFAGYEGEIMRGAFAGVPRGELEAARAFGMPRHKILYRIWLPRAVQRALPTLNGEIILQLKATPLVATITVFETYAVFGKIRQETFITYEPLLLLALTYLCLAGILSVLFKRLENRVPTRRG